MVTGVAADRASLVPVAASLEHTASVYSTRLHWGGTQGGLGQSAQRDASSLRVFVTAIASDAKGRSGDGRSDSRRAIASPPDGRGLCHGPPPGVRALRERVAANTMVRESRGVRRSRDTAAHPHSLVPTSEGKFNMRVVIGAAACLVSLHVTRENVTMLTRGEVRRGGGEWRRRRRPGKSSKGARGRPVARRRRQRYGR